MNESRVRDVGGRRLRAAGLRGVYLAGAALVVAAGGAGTGCSSGEDPGPRAKVGPSIVFPRGAFENVRKLTLTVYETSDGVDCGADGNASGPATRPIATQDLGTRGCAQGAKFCGELTLGQSSSARVFLAAGLDAGGDRIANGCAKALVNQGAVPVEIRMRRFIKPPFCGDGVIQPSEQCEKSDPICDGACHTGEVYLSGGHLPGGTANGKAGDKKNPVLLWPQGSGDAGRLVAFFGDRTPGPTEITLRVLSDGFGRHAAGGAEMADYSFFLPNDPAASFPPAAEPQNQFAPSAAFAAGKYFVVYQDEGGGNPEIRLRSMTSSFVAEQGPQSPIGINGEGGIGEEGAQTHPVMALGANGHFLVAWEDSRSGTVRGRTYHPTSGARGKQYDDWTAGSARGVSVAAVGGSSGAAWVIAWESAGTVKIRLIGHDGAPLGPERTVPDGSHGGAQTHPAVAGLADGRFAVVWNDRGRTNGDVFVQRYTLGAQGAEPVAGDQAEPLNDRVSEGEQLEPTLGASSAAGGSYVAAWIDTSSGQVRARFLGGSGGFLFNHVDGQETEFQASIVSGRARANPTVASGGSGPYVAIGWEDTTNDGKAGVYGRRFPVGE
ncbi:DUF4215 domain-containing protein [Pendulispora albinea]|uniref:DUF4215 domain-containing protein n=1 Tax=Pendulispora albinea TaxID=2741071 RepID=A0ABZ2LMY3_9BACT